MSHPDADIFPHATEKALETVASHSAPQDLIFYAGWFCPFVQRTWIALEEKGIPYQYKEVNPYHKEKHFLGESLYSSYINPKGLVPAIEYHGKPLYESLIICEFLEDAFPSTPRLLPADPFERANARLWIDHISKAVVPSFFRLVQAQDPEKQAIALEENCKALRALAEAVKGPYFGGEEWGLVDTAVVPWIVRDYVIAEHRGYKRADVGGGWEEYAKRLESRESVLRTSSGKKHYEKIYGRYLRDEAQSEAAKATREGRPVP
ncbi:glutathione-S-transferase [Artomyces pyxidatus]|uniref:Glutathione-S-transferase n=1 Tax=Artomyces pyxidatus TaxID=48021 RepID=A0ACB8T0K1_9AGAM|nr:glutathione-S-transferase [Artomyces pyxidatus]